MERNIYNKLDGPLVVFTLALVLVGLANLFSATYRLPVARFFNNQLLWMTLGIAMATILTFINYNVFERVSWPFYTIALTLLVLVLYTSEPVAGSVRWFKLGKFSLQPSELMKPALIFVLARIFSRRNDRPPYGLMQLMFPLITILLPMYFIHEQPDLGTTLLLGITAVSMILFVGVERRTLLVFFGATLILIPVAWYFLMSDYQKARVVTFIEPEKHSQQGGYQVNQAKIAVGSGMLTGRGFLNGKQTKLMFLPKQYTDFIFSNFAEEWGFLGCVTLIFLYLMFILSGLNIAMRAKDKYGSLVAFGFTSYFFWHIVINIAMELGLLPVVGIPLPFLSYGGSITLSAFIGIGVLLSVNLRRFMF